MSPRTYNRTVSDASVLQWGEIKTWKLRGETEKCVGGSIQLISINITLSSIQCLLLLQDLLSLPPQLRINNTALHMLLFTLAPNSTQMTVHNVRQKQFYVRS